MGRDDNIKIFQDTERACKEHICLKTETKKSIESQRVILEKDELSEPHRRRHDIPMQIIVSKKRSYEAASAYKGEKICVHNFASASNPGGGVTRGANAQEECLCRCSNLYFCLNEPKVWNKYYKAHRSAKNPLHNDDIIYTPNVTVFKTDNSYPKIMDETEWYHVNVITCAAPNLRERPSNRYNDGDGNIVIKILDDELQKLHEKRLRRILDVAAMYKNEVLILGAFGCGAFANKPEIVAKAARNVIEEYKYVFKTIEFAVYCSPRDECNYTIFNEILSEM